MNSPLACTGPKHATSRTRETAIYDAIKTGALRAVKCGSPTFVLADNLQREIDARKTERFFWIFACSMLSYAIIVKMLDSAIAATAIFVLMIVFLLGMAVWLGVDHVVILLER